MTWITLILIVSLFDQGDLNPVEISKREILIPLIVGGLLGCSVALLQRRGVDFHYPKPIQLEVLPFKK